MENYQSARLENFKKSLMMALKDYVCDKSNTMAKKEVLTKMILSHPALDEFLFRLIINDIGLEKKISIKGYTIYDSIIDYLNLATDTGSVNYNERGTIIYGDGENLNKGREILTTGFMKLPKTEMQQIAWSIIKGY